MNQKNSKQLKRKILSVWSNLIQTTDSKSEITVDQILSTLKKEPPYTRLPEKLLLKEINDFISNQKDKIVSEKQAASQSIKLNFMNKSLPFMKQPEIKKRKDSNDQENNIYKKVKLNNEQLLNQVADLEDLGGIETLINELLEFIELPLKQSHIVSQLNVTWRRGILLTGLPGSGKTTIALSVCKYMNKQYGISFYYKSSTEIIGGISGESENNIRLFFKEACDNSPSIVFLDDIDQIGGGETGVGGSKDMLKRMTCQLSQSLDNLPSTVFVIAATSRPDNLSTSLRRSGRFDRELTISIPDEPERLLILQKLLAKLPIPDKQNLITILAQQTSGYVASDLTSLIRESGFIATKRLALIQDEEKILEFANEDFLKGLKQVQPTGLREGFATIPDVTFSDIGALSNIRKALYNSIILPIKTPTDFTKFHMNRSAGILLYGPPGCGKTLIAKAIANESHAHFISIRGPELIDKFVGETERAIRQVFSRARMQKPCVIFFDEVDAICQKRDERAEAFGKRLVNQLLVELDGWEMRTDVYVIAATNRPEILDEAVLRQGRLGEKMYVGLPDQNEREEILQTLLKKMPVNWEQIDLSTIAKNEKLERFSGADLAALVREAGLQAILDHSEQLQYKHLLSAMQTIKTSISPQELQRYEQLQYKFEKCQK